MRRAPGEWLYRALLRTYPREFRRRFGVHALEAFREQWQEPEYRGRGGRLRFWRDVAADYTRSVLRARMAGRTEAGNGGVAFGRAGATGRWEVGMDGMRQDLAFAIRSLLRAPGFTAVAVLTLAIGIGSNAAIFGVVRSVLLQPLPYGDADEVVTIWSQWNGFPKTWVSFAEYRAYLNRGRSFQDLAIWSETDVNFTDPDNPERVGAIGASENLVDVLGVQMQAGRFFTRDEALRADSLPTDVVVVSHDAWVRRWDRDPGIVGTTTEMNGRQREVIGVLPAGFRLPTEFGRIRAADVYFPMYVPRDAVTDFPEGGGSHGWHVAGRLREGVSVETARADVASVIEGVHRDFGAYPAERGFSPLLYGVSEDVFGTIRPALVALLATVAFVLLIACANVANLLLARSDDRADELAVRAALGAGRRRLVSQMLVESLVLATVGGLTGLGLALLGVDVFKALNPGNLPRIDEVSLDPVVLAFTAALTLLTAVGFGVLPAWRTTGQDLKRRMGRRAERGVGRAGWQGTLVALETAAAVVLVVGAGLMARTFASLSSIEPGFEAERTLTVAVSLPTTRYPDAAASTAFWREALQQVSDLPGVQSVGAIRSLPLGSAIGDWGLDVAGYDESVNPRAAGDWQIAAPGYFETMGIPLVAGRTIDWNDDQASAPVAVVNEAFVRRYADGRDPLGLTFTMGGNGGTPISVVGVAGDVTHNGLTAEIKPKFYIPAAQWVLATRGNPTSLRLVARSAGDPRDLVGPVRDVIRGLDPSLAVAEVRTVDDIMSAAVAQPRFVTVLMGAFSLVALILAVVGVYGVVAYGVGKRTQEIGVRIALGAVQEDIVGLMLRKGSVMVAVGLGAGLVGALLLSRFLSSQLYGVAPTDPATFGAVAVGFGFVALLATWLPSRRAARVDPIRALKAE